jgi:hypothetical protein
MTTYMSCHICGAETEFTCERCEEPVCEDCCTPMTIHNQIDYALCTDCNDYREESARAEWRREDKIKQEKKAKKDAANAKARATYWKPENVDKREAAKKKRKKEQAELRQKQLQETFRIVGDMLRGM